MTTLLEKARSAVDIVAPWRRKYGLAGIPLGLAFRRLHWAAPKGALVGLRVPGYPNTLYGRAGTADWEVFDQHFLREELAGMLPARARLIIDAGANVGYTAAYFARQYPDARIICLEVHDGNLELLRRNTAGLPNIEVRGEGLWSHRARLAIVDPAAKYHAFSVAERADGPIPATGIAELLEERGVDEVDIVKIDIEGGEYEVFSHGVERWLPRARVVLAEPHDRFRPGCTDAIMSAARRFGFGVHEAGEYLVLTRPERPLPRKES
jgi:FkbM family methyltransferase